MSLSSCLGLGALSLLIATGFVVAVPNPASAHTVEQTSSSTGVEALDACPVPGGSDFVDSWGDARSGGRRHQGVDVAADRGTPVVAVSDGEAEFKRSNLGGNSIWLVTSSGERFFYAHLDSWEGSSRKVTAGEVVGYVGSSGNARGNHLHFETHAGDRPVNPYPLVETACSVSAQEFAPAFGRRIILR